MKVSIRKRNLFAYSATFTFSSLVGLFSYRYLFKCLVCDGLCNDKERLGWHNGGRKNTSRSTGRDACSMTKLGCRKRKVANSKICFWVSLPELL